MTKATLTPNAGAQARAFRASPAKRCWAISMVLPFMARMYMDPNYCSPLANSSQSAERFAVGRKICGANAPLQTVRLNVWLGIRDKPSSETC